MIRYFEPRKATKLFCRTFASDENIRHSKKNGRCGRRRMDGARSASGTRLSDGRFGRVARLDRILPVAGGPPPDRVSAQPGPYDGAAAAVGRHGRLHAVCPDPGRSDGLGLLFSAAGRAGGGLFRLRPARAGPQGLIRFRRLREASRDRRFLK